MTDEQLNSQKEELQQLASKFPDKGEYEIYLLDQVERLLTNSRDQTKYLKTISTIITVLVILSIIGWIIAQIFS